MSPSDKRRIFGWKITGAISLTLLLGGLVSFGYSQSLAADVQSLEAAVPCTTQPAGSSCYLLRDVTITRVEVYTEKSGAETATVKFVDADIPHEVSVRPANHDSSALWAGEAAVAVLWRGRYTQLQVGGKTFVTSDNPVRDRNQSRLFAFCGIFIGLGLAASIPVDVRMYRARARAAFETRPVPPGGEQD